jgi:hypothetical protein
VGADQVGLRVRDGVAIGLEGRGDGVGLGLRDGAAGEKYMRIRPFFVSAI